MKTSYKLVTLCAGFFVVFFLFGRAFAADFLQPIGHVNDFAGILAQEEKAQLEQKLVEFEQQTSNEIAVVTVRSLQGLDIFTYSQELFTAWGIGKEQRNNGILMLLGPKEGLPFPERGDIFINVGKGLEGALPDSVTGSIIRHEITSSFKEQRFSEGITRGVAAIMDATKGEYEPLPEDQQPNSNSTNLPIPLDFILVFGFMVFTYVGTFLARSKSWWLGGVIGGGAGLILGLFIFSGWEIIGSTAILGMVGLIFDRAVSRNYQQRKARGQPTDFWHSGGGFWGGGSGGGFGGGGGGFGGFGGGRSGGGGAGGSW